MRAASIAGNIYPVLIHETIKYLTSCLRIITRSIRAGTFPRDGSVFGRKLRVNFLFPSSPSLTPPPASSSLFPSSLLLHHSSFSLFPSSLLHLPFSLLFPPPSSIFLSSFFLLPLPPPHSLFLIGRILTFSRATNLLYSHGPQIPQAINITDITTGQKK